MPASEDKKHDTHVCISINSSVGRGNTQWGKGDSVSCMLLLLNQFAIAEVLTVNTCLTTACLASR